MQNNIRYYSSSKFKLISLKTKNQTNSHLKNKKLVITTLPFWLGLVVKTTKAESP
jgi:hypothetical protein